MCCADTHGTRISSWLHGTAGQLSHRCACSAPRFRDARSLWCAIWRQHGLLWKLSLEQLHDKRRLGDDSAIELQHRQHARRNLLRERRLLVAVAPHVDLLDGVGDLLLLEEEPHLLAVGAPCRVIAIQVHPRRLAAAKCALQCGRVRSALRAMTFCEAPGFSGTGAQSCG